MPKKKPTKPKPNKYEEKLIVNASFEDLIKLSVSPKNKKDTK